MKNKFLFFICTLLSLFFLFGMFIYSVKLTEDENHMRDFNTKYQIFSILHPSSFDFAGEVLPSNSSEIFERIDKQMLKNIYWQSNTLLYFKRANKYFPIIEPILKKHNIPDDFKFLALIESGLQNVVSPAGATGFWQILKSTAREYNLEVNSAIDERYNLEKSTEFACTYLKSAYNQFGSWTMAAASYNMGKNGLQRRSLEQKTNNYFNLKLSSETSEYIFRIVAVKEILQNPKKYGFIFREKDLYTMPSFKTIIIDSTINDLNEFAISNSINFKLLKEFNPWLRTNTLPNASRKSYDIKIPLDTIFLVFDEVKLSVDSLK